MMIWILVGVIVILLGVIGRMISNSRLVVADIYDLIAHLRVAANGLDRLSIVFMEMSNNLNAHAKPEEQSVITWLRENHRLLQLMKEAHLTTISQVGDGVYKKFESRWHKSISKR